MTESSRNDINELTEIVKTSYSNPDEIRRYMKVGLWSSEETLIDKFFDPRTSILDIGCGAGRTSIALAKKGYHVLGIDLVPEMIEAAKYQAYSEHLELDFKVMDITNIELSKESFQNALFLFNGFENISGQRNREKVLTNVWEILKLGGYFIITFRSGLAVGKRTFAWLLVLFEYIIYKLIMRKNWEFGDKLWKNEYYHYINPFKFKEMVRTVGFQIVYFNSSRNIDKGKKETFFTNFSSDIALFFVLKKAAKRLS
ncbi:MAG: class I SAM-dependent methyltransferase [Deltaproteobacteria bacterium]|nr:class I SAM-dependent methyltransferase [Deltaproteobacteria bacterium]